LYFLDIAKLEYWRILFVSLLSENNMSFRKYIIQISTYCLLMHLCKFLEITKKNRIVLIICYYICIFQHHTSIYSFYFGTYSIRTDFQQKISCIDFMPRIYPQYFAYLASSVIAANFLDKKLSLIDKMCVIQHKNRKFYPILWYTKKTFFSAGKNCKKFVVSGLFIILF